MENEEEKIESMMEEWKKRQSKKEMYEWWTF